MRNASIRKILSFALAGCAMLGAPLATQAAPTARDGAHARPLHSPAPACDARCLAQWFDAQRQITDGSVAAPRR